LERNGKNRRIGIIIERRPTEQVENGKEFLVEKREVG
jgi:hypothetical protein